MQPLMIILLIALLVALVNMQRCRMRIETLCGLVDAHSKSEMQYLTKFLSLQSKYDAAIMAANKANLDNVFLRAELKRKHRRIPKI